MKLHATRIPSSSVVGVSIGIRAWKNGPNIAVLALLDVRNDDGKHPQGPDAIIPRQVGGPVELVAQLVSS